MTVQLPKGYFTLDFIKIQVFQKKECSRRHIFPFTKTILVCFNVIVNYSHKYENTPLNWWFCQWSYSNWFNECRKTWVLLSKSKGFAYTETPQTLVWGTGSGTWCLSCSPVVKWMKGSKFDRCIPVVFLKIFSYFSFTLGVTIFIHLPNTYVITLVKTEDQSL